MYPTRALPPRLPWKARREGMEADTRARASLPASARWSAKLLLQAGADCADLSGRRTISSSSSCASLVADLDIETRIVAAPTAREQTGSHAPHAMPISIRASVRVHRVFTACCRKQPEPWRLVPRPPPRWMMRAAPLGITSTPCIISSGAMPKRLIVRPCWIVPAACLPRCSWGPRA